LTESFKRATQQSWDKITIKNKEGLALSALLRQGGCETAGGKNDGARGLVIACHGFTGSKEGGGRALDMGESLAQSGYSTLLFDFAGCGESDGAWENITLSGQISDLGAVTDWCRRQGFERIIFNGRSFGGTTALCYGARDRKIAAVCTWAAVARPARLFANRVAGRNLLTGDPHELIELQGEEGTVALKRRFFIDLSKHDPLKNAAGISPSPLFVIHGSADQSVPVEEARMLYEQAKEPKQLLVLEGADHRFSEHLVPVWDAFFDWLKKI